MNAEGFARLAFEAYHDADHPAGGGWDAWSAMMPDGIERGKWLAVGELIEELTRKAVRDAGRTDESEPPARYALVEQMGHRATVATVRETTFCGKQMIEATDLKGGGTSLIAPESLYEITWLTEGEARTRVKPWTATALPLGAVDLGDPWGVSESDDTDPDEGKDDGMSSAERDEYDRDAEFRLDAADEARDLEREAEADL